ncbi:phage replisome organizer N-terminal domain-containing protein [Dehalococcoides mccartyi]|uniref:phage replisome organizer N-terminal domain-containing protein n=1 Tax=Dehalococcoides mccartyi TaxID=61435 RepID=UPI0008053063|nr:phage replisome organizer N-terminal domain-containing protein [Dehalococcoides mccartyi]OBW61978.1 MAG: hypothetical protein A9181_03145 [Dehalococcoides mccartyi]
MGSRTWFKIYPDNWLRNSIVGSETGFESMEERGVFSAVLALAASGRYGDIGAIKIGENIGYSDQQIADIFGINLDVWVKYKAIFIHKSRLSVDKNNLILVTNWTKYQSEYERQKPYRVVTTNSYKEKEKEKEKENKEDIISSVFDHWNTSGIVKHRILTERMKKAISNTLLTYSFEEINKAITNYGRILARPDLYRFSYRWQLDDFLGPRSNHVGQFLEWEIAHNNYKRDDHKPLQQTNKFKPTSQAGTWSR